jgi:hypothetical protein
MQRALILRENKKNSLYVSKIDMEVVELIPLDFFFKNTREHRVPSFIKIEKKFYYKSWNQKKVPNTHDARTTQLCDSSCRPISTKRRHPP